VSPDVTESIKARLLEQARSADAEFQHYLVRYACERFLYRLGEELRHDMSPGLLPRVEVYRLDRLLGGLPGDETAPIVMAVSPGTLGLIEIALRLSRPVSRAIHGAHSTESSLPCLSPRVRGL
jgi:hypothetical protein